MSDDTNSIDVGTNAVLIIDSQTDIGSYPNIKVHTGGILVTGVDGTDIPDLLLRVMQEQQRQRNERFGKDSE